MSNIREVEQNMRDFDQKVEMVIKKFKRLHADWLKLSARLEQQSDEIAVQARSMTEDHDAQTKIISTLVEMEFMQQALDLQDEHDRNQIHLYGLNDTHFTIEDFMADLKVKNQGKHKVNAVKESEKRVQ